MPAASITVVIPTRNEEGLIGAMPRDRSERRWGTSTVVVWTLGWAYIRSFWRNIFKVLGPTLTPGRRRS